MKEIRKLEIDDYEYRLLIESLSAHRNSLLENDLPTEDINDMLLKVIDTKPERGRAKEYER